VTPGAEIAGMLVFGTNRVEFRGSGWLPEAAASAARAMVGARLSLVAAGARYCRAFFQRAIEIWGCPGVEAGALLGMSYGVTHPASGAAPWVAPGAGAVGLWSVSPRVSVALALEGLIPLIRESFQIAGVGELYRPPSLTGRAQIGLEFRFPVTDRAAAGHSAP
jgi:hypothetical protein